MQKHLKYGRHPTRVATDLSGIKKQDVIPSFNLLIVEDSHNYRWVFKELLMAHFHSVVIEEATSGEEALIKMENFLPDIIILDIELPGSSGLEIAKTIRKSYGTIVTIIVLTSQSRDVLKKTALACGADAFFEKGTPFDIIADAIKTFLDMAVTP